jgi:hypothetical protein
MTLGIALVLIFVLYLIDAHSRWRQALKGVLWLAVIGAILACVWAGLLLWEASGPKKQAAPQNQTSPTLASRPVWIYVDIAEEFDGYLTTRPVVPSQIKDMIAKNVDCVPGSTTYGTDKIEWICIQPGEFPTGLPSGAILVPIPAQAPNPMKK